MKILNMKKEFLQGKRYSINALNKMDESFKVNYINEMLLYDDKISRQVAQIHAKILKEHLDNAQVQEQLLNKKEIWVNGNNFFN